eukprot:scaffold5160_cov152-Cylindrotheca_fusiformis.AAC.1
MHGKPFNRCTHPLSGHSKRHPPRKAFARGKLCFIMHAFLSSHHTPRHHPTPQALLLVARLGRWLPTSQWLQAKWTSFYSYDTHALYFQQTDTLPLEYGIHTHQPRSRLRHPPKFEILANDTTTDLPQNAIPVDAVMANTAIIFPSVTSSTPSTGTTATTTPTTFDDYVQCLPHWDWELIHTATFQAEDHSMQELILFLTDNNTTLLIGSDGGAKGSTGSFGAVIATQHRGGGFGTKILL